MRIALLLLPAVLMAAGTAPMPHAWVHVGDPGNAPEPRTGWGAVRFEFELGRCEITNAQYAQFLNAVAVNADPYTLWHRNQAEGPMGGIVREETSVGYVYRVRTGFVDLPVVYVSWFSAARFCNWLHYGQPDAARTAASPATEGDPDRGAYDTRFFPPTGAWPGDAAYLPARRNAHARYWLPSLDEWIKAGFYQPGTGGRYWRYATHSDDVPRAEPPPGGLNSANYYTRGWAVPYPHLTPVGAYAGAVSPSGTSDQAGNVMEWLEDRLPDAPHKRRFAGGAAARFATMLPLDYADWEDADHTLMVVGFRVARACVESGHALSPVAATPASAPDVSPTAAVDDSFVRTGLEFVRVGEPGNPPDQVYGRGAVTEVFEIGKYELTNADYAAFLNAVTRVGDPQALYERSMGDGLLGGITRVEVAGEFHYRTKSGWANWPVTYLNWYRLARFANWLHFGRPDTGGSTLGTTEGDAERGAYDTQQFPTREDDAVARDRLPARRNAGARYFLPTEDEWFKAAYYDPTRGAGNPYWTYPVRSDDRPNNRPPPGTAHSVNYVTDRFCLGMPFVLTPVGAFVEARSYFGTYDQGGNVWEWTESWRVPQSPTDWRAHEDTRVLRGGSATYSFIGVSAANADPGHPNHSLAVYGGRIARRPQ